MDLSDTAPPAKPLPLVFQAVKQNTSDDSDSSHPPRRNPPAKEKISSVKLFFFSVDLYHSQALLSRTPVIQKNFFMIQKTPDDTISVSSGACLHLWKVVPPVHIKNREHGHKSNHFRHVFPYVGVIRIRFQVKTITSTLIPSIWVPHFDSLYRIWSLFASTSTTVL